jgi:hypothetical protein
MNESADFVMYWWDRAAEFLTAKGTPLRRFGLVTTNSITQEFSRRVMKKRIESKHPISIVMAIPDHPWTKATADAAAVRIAMTVVEAGKQNGLLREVTRESELDTDQPIVEFRDRQGQIHSDLTIGINITSALELRSNEGLCCPGVKLHGDGFIVTRQEAEHLGLGRRPDLEMYIREYRNGRDITGHPRGVMVIDLFGLEADDVKRRYPEVYQHVKAEVKEKIVTNEDGEKDFVGRDWNNRETYRKLWWIFGEPRRELRPALEGLKRYIATTETAKHRFFQFLSRDILPDNMLVCVAMEEAFCLGVLSSRIHVVWTLMQGGTLEDRPRYTKSACFDPFPFPSAGELLKDQIGTAAEELDGFRKERQKENPSLTLTQIYNVLERIRAHEPLDEDEERIKKKGLILVLKDHHDKIDRLVFQAYGWPDSLTDEQILEKLVALNHERAAEERRGQVRWLRPEYQIPRFGKDLDKMAAKEEQIVADLGLPAAAARKATFPADAVEQTAAVFAALAAASGAVSAGQIAQNFRKTKNLEETIAKVLLSLARLGHVSMKDGRMFEIRRVA